MKKFTATTVIAGVAFGLVIGGGLTINFKSIIPCIFAALIIVIGVLVYDKMSNESSGAS